MTAASTEQHRLYCLSVRELHRQREHDVLIHDADALPGAVDGLGDLHGLVVHQHHVRRLDGRIEMCIRDSSKTVVHEGLRELHRLGFLDIAARRGVTVADYAQTGSLETLRAIMDVLLK